MIVAAYFVAKSLAWVGLIVGIFFALRPEQASKLIAAGSRLRPQGPGMDARINPTTRDMATIRAWSLVAAAMSATLVLVLTFVVTLAYQMQ